MRRAARALLAAGCAFLVAAGAAAEGDPGALPEEWPPAMDDSMLQYLVLATQLEFRLNDGVDVARWEIEAWLGGDYNKIWLKTEGEANVSGSSDGDAEVQLLYGRTISPFWDFQVGVRQDVLFGSHPDHARTFAVIGMEGLAPLWFELTPAFFVSDGGDVSARLEGTYDLLLMQRLVLQPRLELNIAAHDARNFGIESGFNDIELGLRLRYEVRRELAPYVGVNWLRKLGDTAGLARAAGEDTSVVGAVLGLRVWF